MLTAAEILGPTGRIAARLPHYEQRPEQLAMADAVADAIAQRKHLLAEAGTGVGKSFAYLAPAILAAAADGANDDGEPRRRVVISTHTISLQEQLLTRDIPLLRSVIPLEFSAVLVKGRKNYLSLRRLANAQARAVSLFHRDEDFVQLRTIAEWAKETGDGSQADLSFTPDSALWDEIGSDSGNCLGRNCPTYKDCFYFRARRRMQHAQILIVNHALFFSDLALRQSGVSILPDYDVAVFDEAHTIEGVASDHLGDRITSGQVDYLLNKLHNDRTNRGLVVHHRMAEAERDVLRCRTAADEFFANVAEWLQQRGKTSLRVTKPKLFENLLGPRLQMLSRRLKSESSGLPDEQRIDFTSAADRLTLLAGSLSNWLDQADLGQVYWLESNPVRRGVRITLANAPLEVGPALRAQLFDKVPTVIMTSATLSVGKQNSFDYIKNRIGLTQAASHRWGSPFNYKEQATLVQVEGMADPSEDRNTFERQCVPMIRRYVEETDGRAFVLFTSYDMLSRTASALSPWLAEKNLALYSQGDGTPRSLLLDRFREQPRGVLLGTDSFWQGVDVPGDALQNVIITKLPFSVPDRPLTEARLAAIRERGGNPFSEYTLPEAVLKLRQGFGRLIRSKRDRGMVVILDPRIRTKPYGRMFLESLPDCAQRTDSYAG